jgi:hypothetical protein
MFPMRSDQQQRVYVYNENCVMAGRSVPQRIIDEHPDPENGGDWTLFDGTEAELVELARERFRHAHKGAAGAFDRRVARTIAETFGGDLEESEAGDG